MDPTLILGTIISILFAGNIFFIKKLVDKIDSTSVASSTALASTEQLKGTVNGVANQLREIKQDIKDLRHIEIEVAVLKSHIGVKTQSDS